VQVVGEQWTARSGSGETIASGRTVRVVAQDGLTLIVEAERSAGA
jgi:membrane-bound ClpP family serine protease